MALLPSEVQGYIRHILHSIGVMIVAWGGMSENMLEVYVGLLVNLISIGWFLYVSYKKYKKEKQIQESIAALEEAVEQ